MRDSDRDKYFPSTRPPNGKGPRIGLLAIFVVGRNVSGVIWLQTAALKMLQALGSKVKLL
jgi:hypothetical protein